MPRKGPVAKRPVAVDPVYGSPVVSQLVNKILLDGKKSLAEKTVYGALEGTNRKTGDDPVVLLKKAWTTSAQPLRLSLAAWVVPPTRCQSRSRPHRANTLGNALVGPVRTSTSREDHDRAPNERDLGCLQRSWCSCEASRRHSQDGRVQQGICSLPLVIQQHPRGFDYQSQNPADELFHQLVTFGGHRGTRRAH